MSRWIDRAADDRADDRFVVTCRDAGWRGETVLGPAFLELHVRPLDERQRADFVARWFRAVRRRELGACPEADAEAAVLSGKLTALLESGDFRVRAGLAQLVANPLLLTILCVVYRKELDLPRRRVELYAKCVDVLLHHWRNAKGMEGLTLGPARAVLQPLAWWMHEQPGRTEAEAEPMAAHVTPLLASMGRDAPAPDGAGFLDRACDQSGLLVRPGPERYAFLHLSFQEYLAAAHAAPSPVRAAFLAQRFGQSWWKETTLLALGQGTEEFSGAFFEAVLDLPEPDRELLELCLDDALFAPLGPFLRALDGSPARQALLLRMLARRRDPTLVERARALAGSRDAGVAAAARELLLQAGERPIVENERLDGRTGIVLVRIQAGSFLMGSPKTEEGRFDREGPQHEIAITRDFWMGKHPVTNEQYARFLEANPKHRKPDFWDDGRFNQPRQPVVGVSCHDAAVFCKWAGGSDRSVRLPREAEWEYACRAGTTGARYGDLDEIAWHGGNSGGSTHPVGEKAPNAWGLYDTIGNVWEWTADAYAVYSPQAKTVDPAAAPADAGDAVRVFRGGCWAYGPRRCRSAYRNGRRPEVRVGVQGFRVLCPIAPSRH